MVIPARNTMLFFNRNKVLRYFYQLFLTFGCVVFIFNEM